MLEILTLLSYLVALAIVFYLFVSVILYAYETQPELEKDTLVHTAQAIFMQAYLLIQSVGTAFLVAAAAYAAHAVSMFRFYMIMGLVVFGAEMTVRYHSSVLSNYDQGNTKYFLPRYHDTVMPIANSVRVGYDLSICWTNLAASRFRIFTNAVYAVTSDCAEADFQNVADKIGDFLISPLQSLIDWVASSFGDPFNFYRISLAFSEVGGSAQPFLNCMCLDLSFAWNIILQGVQAPRLHYAIDGVLNAGLEVIKVPFIALITFFRTGFFSCAEPTPDQQVICLAARPPKFAPIRDNLDNATDNLVGWVDDVFQIIFDQFFESSGFQLPKIRALVSKPVSIVFDLANNLMDFLFHIDLVFGPSSPPKVKYLQFIDIDTPFAHAYEFNTDGVQQFFGAFDLDVTDNIGCILSRVGNATVRSAEFGTRVFILWTVNTTAVNSYIATYNKQPLLDDLDNISLCTSDLIREINGPLGDIVEHATNTFARSVILFVNIFDHIETGFSSYLEGQMGTDLDAIFAEMVKLAISLGNFFRQMNISPGTCPPKSVDTPDAPNPTQVDLFCCYGNYVESVLRFFISLVKLFKDLIVAGFTQTPAQVFQNEFHLETTVIPQFEAAIESVACMPAMFFPTTLCASSDLPSTDTYQSVVQDLIFSALNFTSIILRGPNVVINIVRMSLNGRPLNEIACTMLLGGYDVGVGNLLNVARALSTVGACFSDSGSASRDINQIGKVFWDSFGWDNSMSFRYLICQFAHAFATVITFLVGFFQDPGAAVYGLISGAVNDILGPITDAVNAIKARFDNLLTTLRNIFNQIGSILGNLFVQMFKCVLSCLSFDCNNNDCDFSNINIPNIGNLKRRIEYPMSPIDYSKNKRSTDDGYENDYFFTNDIIYWPSNNTMCNDILQMLNDTTLNNATRYLIIMDLKRCMTSAALSRSIDILLLNLDPNAPPMINPETFYDPIIGWQTLSNVTTVANEFVKFKSAGYNNTGNWTYYAQNHGMNDSLSIRLGVIIDMFLNIWTSAETNNGSSSNVIHGISFIGSVLYQYGYQTWFGNESIPLIMKRGITQAASARYGKKTMFVAGHILSHPNWGHIYDKTIGVLLDWHGNMSANIIKKIQTKDERILRNRFGFMRIMNRISDSIDNAKEKYLTPTTTNDTSNNNTLTNNNETLSKSIVKKERRGDLWSKYLWGTPIHSFDENYYTTTSPAYANPFEQQKSKRGDITIDPCFPGQTGETCLKCRLLTEVVDDYVNAVARCIADIQKGVIVDQTLFLARTPYSTDTGSSISTSMKSNVSSIIISHVDSSSNASFNIVLADWLQWLLDQIIAGAGKLKEWLIDGPGRFLGSPNSGDPNSLFFWAEFMVMCNYQEMTRCEEGPQGLGLPESLKIVLYVYAVILGLAVLFPPFLTLLMFIIPFTFVFLMATAYLMSPSCMIPTPLISLPNCFADDSLIFMSKFDLECLPWQSILPGLTTIQCPSVTQDYKRDFVHCEDSPYYFVDGTRNFFFLIEWHYPSINAFLRTTPIPFFSWIYSIGYFKDKMTFDFGASGVPNDTWISCNAITSLNYGPITSVAVEGLFLFLFFLPPVFLLVFTVLQIVALLLNLVMEIISSISRYQFNRNSYFKNQGELMVPPKSSYIPTNNPFGNSSSQNSSKSQSPMINRQSYGIHEQQTARRRKHSQDTNENPSSDVVITSKGNHNTMVSTFYSTARFFKSKET